DSSPREGADLCSTPVDVITYHRSAPPCGVQLPVVDIHPPSLSYCHEWQQRRGPTTGRRASVPLATIDDRRVSEPGWSAGPRRQDQPPTYLARARGGGSGRRTEGPLPTIRWRHTGPRWP